LKLAVDWCVRINRLDTSTVANEALLFQPASQRFRNITFLTPSSTCRITSVLDVKRKIKLLTAKYKDCKINVTQKYKITSTIVSTAKSTVNRVASDEVMQAVLWHFTCWFGQMFWLHKIRGYWFWMDTKFTLPYQIFHKSKKYIFAVIVIHTGRGNFE